MQINNTTKWSSSCLRSIFKRCMREVYAIERPTVKKGRMIIDVKNSHGSKHMNGRATVNGHWIMIKIGTLSDMTTFEGKQTLARIFIHEFYHILGYSYWDKNNYKHDTSANWNVDWVKEYTLEEKPMSVIKVIDIQSVRYEKAKTNADRAQTRFKRAKTLLQKWLRKVKYYEFVLANKKINK